MAHKYSLQGYNEEHSARAVGLSLPISTKKSIEVCNKLRNLRLEKAKRFLEDVVKGKQAVAYTRFNKDTGHKRGIGPARYPMKTAEVLIRLLKSVEANAQFKGLSTADLVISNIHANRASRQWHFGRQLRTKMKRTHIEIMVEEKKTDKKKPDRIAEKSAAQNKEAGRKEQKKETRK